MTKKLYILTLFMALLLSGCAMDDWYQTGEVPDRDYMEFDFAVPEPTVVETRAGSLSEDDVKDAIIFFFKNAERLEGCELLQAQRVYFSDGKCVESKIEYNEDLKSYLRGSESGQQVRVVAVANSGMSQADADGIGNIKNLQSKCDLTPVDERTTMTMSGFPNISGQDKELVSRTDLNKKVTINLYRNAAKATVSLTANDATKDFALSQFALWSYGEKGYFTAAAYNRKEGVKNSDKNQFGNFTSEAAYGYAQQGYTTNDSARNELGNDKRAYLIVEGEYKAQKCYYRIDFIQKVKDESTEEVKSNYLFLTPNHEYKINIVKVRCKGYASPEEASKHPMSDFMEVEIHDHLSSVLSMTSDGLRELGVTKDVYHKNTDNDAGLSFVMKLFSHVSADEYPTLTLDEEGNYVDTDKGFSMKIVQGSEWLGFKSQNGNGTDNSGEAHTGAGKVYTIGLDYKTTKFTGELKGTIRINWQGLTRDVSVTWEKTFNPSDICSVSLVISTTGVDNSTPAEIDDYWKFLEGKDSDHPLFGVDKSENNGNVRNQGFHLPLYYGGTKDADKWTYTYTITPKSGLGTIEAVYDAATMASEGTARAFEGIDAFANLDSKITNNGSSVVLKVKATEYSWNYMVGKIILKIGGVEYPFDIYHTGFFHNETSGNALAHTKGTKPATGYYYYEVRTINYKNNSYHWLDRNIAASAGAMAVRDNSGADLIANGKDDRFHNGAVGAYITPAEYVEYANVEEKIYENLCPPGFRIPTSKEWDDMRNSGNFITTETTADGVPFYQACLYDNRGNEVFFPKVLYQTTEGLVGDSRSGYYWTRTAASGIEKKQIGRWMKAMYMSGSSNAIINGAVNDYGMQIRAISGYDDDAAAEQITIGFKVKGATHVYIYDAGKPWPYSDSWGPMENGKCTYFDANKYGMVTWPGQAIGEASAMLYDNSGHNGSEFTFTYTTTTPKENLRVLFAYVENGKIYVFDRVTEDGKTGTDKYNGWPIVDSYSFQFTNKSAGVYNPDITGTPPSIANYQYVIRWPQIGADNADYYRINVEYKNGGSAPGFSGNTSESFHKEFASPKRFAWIFPQAPSEDEKMIVHIYTHEDAKEKTYKYEVALSDFTLDEVINDKNSKVLDLKEADFIDGHTINGEQPVTYTYQIQWPQIGSTNNDYHKVYFEYSDGTKVSDFSSGSPLEKSRESGSDGNKIFYYNFTTAPTSKAMKMYIYKSNNTDKLVYDGTISLSDFNVTDGTTKICKITDKNKFKEAQSEKDTYTIYYTNPEGWETVKYYLMDNNKTQYSGSAGWPGTLMTKVGDIYTCEIPKDAGYIIFNNDDNGSQTDDIKVVNEDNHTYTDAAKGNGERTYRLYWKWSSGYGTDRNWIYVYTEGDYNVLPETLGDKSHHEKSGEIDGKAYLEFKSTKTDLKFKFIVMRSEASWNDLQSGNWQVNSWTENNGIWENRNYQDTW